MQEGRLLTGSEGDNLAVSLNYVPELDPDVLLSGYRHTLGSLYQANLGNYFERCRTLFEHLGPRERRGRATAVLNRTGSRW